MHLIILCICSNFLEIAIVLSQYNYSRTKVHAQRKFAQGAITVFNTSPTPIKDKEKAKPTTITELITHKRPNTEDFLTFLCFRG